MNESIDKRSNSDSKKITITLVLILVLMVTTTGGTYAYLALSANNATTVTGTVASAGLTLAVAQQPLKNTTNTGVMVPQLETYLGTAMNGTNKCVDGNDNVVCKVYKVTITNTSSAAVEVVGTIKFAGNGSMTNLKWRRVSNATTLGSYTSVAVGTNTTNKYDLSAGTACTTNATQGTQSGCTTVSLKKNGVSGNSQDFYFVVWINETGAAQTDSGTFTATVEFLGENGRGVTSTIVSDS